MEAGEIREFIAKAVDDLPPEYSVPFVLRYDDELSIKEIAELLKLSEAATKSATGEKGCLTFNGVKH